MVTSRIQLCAWVAQMCKWVGLQSTKHVFKMASTSVSLKTDPKQEPKKLQQHPLGGKLAGFRGMISTTWGVLQMLFSNDFTR